MADLFNLMKSRTRAVITAGICPKCTSSHTKIDYDYDIGQLSLDCCDCGFGLAVSMTLIQYDTYLREKRYKP